MKYRGLLISPQHSVLLFWLMRTVDTAELLLVMAG
jgi:hypothetical protein